MIINGNSVHGIFKYSEDVYFEKDDFVVDGNCIYICTSGNSIIGIKPSLDTAHEYYSEYPGNKIVSASEYYDYVNSIDRGLQAEDKYVSAHSLCEILENMYFGFGDNGILSDYILYNPNTGIEYSVRGINDNFRYSERDILDRVIRNNDLNNGFIKVSRNLPEISNIFMEDSNFDSDVVVLKQYTYLDSSDSIPYRVQELMDPEKNKLYFRFSKGQILEGGERDFTNVTVSRWRNLYYDNEDAISKLNSLESYYQERINEVDEKLNKIRRKFCYREIEPTESNRIPSNLVYLEPGEYKDIKSISNLNSEPCILNILIKTQVNNDPVVYKNYTITIDALDAYSAQDDHSEEYIISDNLTLTSTYTVNELGMQKLELNVSNGIIKNIYYRDYYTIEHVHEWVEEVIDPPTCTTYGTKKLTCTICGTVVENQLINPYEHDLMEHHAAVAPTCTTPGTAEYWYCNRCDHYFQDSEGTTQITEPQTIAPIGGGHDITIYGEQKTATCTETGNYEYWQCSICHTYFHDSEGTNSYSGWNDGNDPVETPINPNEHDWSDWIVTTQATCSENGEETRTCNRCDATETRPIQGGNHTPVLVPAVPCADCGSFGIIQHYMCSQCGATFLDAQGTIPATPENLRIYPSGDHVFDVGAHIDILEESSYTDDPDPKYGTGLKTCSVCSHQIEVQLPLKTHRFESESYVNAWYDENTGRHYPDGHQGVCTDSECGGEQRINYNFDQYAPINLQFENHTVPHISSDSPNCNYTEPTCTEYGFWTGTCIYCNEHDVIERDWARPPIGHNIDISDPEAVDWIKSSCTEYAKYVGTCTECGDTNAEMDDIRHKAFGHHDTDEDGVCDECGKNLSNNDSI